MLRSQDNPSFWSETLCECFASAQVYLHRVSKTVHPELSISKRSMEVLQSFTADMFERLVAEAARVTTRCGRETLSAREVRNNPLPRGTVHGPKGVLFRACMKGRGGEGVALMREPQHEWTVVYKVVHAPLHLLVQDA